MLGREEYNRKSFKESSSLVKRSRDDGWKQASEQHIGSCKGDSVSGAPVKELGYTYGIHAVPDKDNMVIYYQTGVAPRRVTTRPQDYRSWG